MPDLRFARTCLRLLVSELDEDRYHHTLCSCPALLRESIRTALRKSSSDNPATRQQFERLDTMADLILKRGRPYSIGGGPIESIAMQLERGEIAMEAALESVRSDLVVDAMVPVYVCVLGDARATNLAHQGKWRDAMRLIRLLRAAIDSAPSSGEKNDNLDVVESVFMEVALCSLIEVPDRRLLVEAEECGLRVVERTENKAGDDHGLALMRLGVLHFDPYVKFRDLANFPGAYQLWHEAFLREYGANAEQIRWEVWSMPPLEQAIDKAVNYLQRAVKARQGRKLGQSFKALAEALSVQAFVRKLPQDTAVIEAAQRALELLDPNKDAHHITTLDRLLERLGKKRDGAPKPNDAELGPRERITFILDQAVQNSDRPREALDSLRTARDLFDQHAMERQREQRLRVMAGLMRPAFAPEENLAAWGSEWPDMVKILGSRQNHGTISSRALAACTVEVALLSTKENNENRALPLLQVVQQADPEFASEYEEVLRFLTFALYQGAAVNSFQGGDYQQALTGYLAAFGVALSLRFNDQALDMLERANDALKKQPDLKVSEDVLSLVGGNWFAGEDMLAETGMLELGELARRLDRCVASASGEDFKTAWLLWQVAKGLRFGSSLNALRLDSKLSEAETDLLDDIQELEHELKGSERPIKFLDEERALLAFLRPLGAGQGGDPAARMVNLQRQFDLLRRRRMASLQPQPAFIGVNEAMDQLGPGTILVNVFLGMAPDDTLAIRWIAIDREGGTAARVSHQVQASPRVIERDGFELVEHPFAPVVLMIRKLIRDDPSFQFICPEGARALEDWEPGILPGLRSFLTSRKQNGTIRHICIIPHGPLHFFPFHLLGPISSPLVDQAVITYLPNLALLNRRPHSTGVGILSIGIGFERFNPHGKSALKDSVEEAQLIAALFGASALSEEEATPQKVLELMPRHRYIHLATHGEQNAFAPSFHHLYLAPGANGEDRLFGHSFDGIDLSAVDMVTLSACETALGRVDQVDNLRGLAAALLRAGVRTVVGTLWETGSMACRTFFTSFYQELQKGVEKRDAFATAQKETRLKHTKYRAWGSFYLMGAWR